MTDDYNGIVDPVAFLGSGSNGADGGIKLRLVTLQEGETVDIRVGGGGGGGCHSNNLIDEDLSWQSGGGGFH